MKAPPQSAVDAAVNTGRYSPCAKSKRGASVYDHRTGRLWGVGYNAQPLPFECTADERCRSACGKLCEHAEQVAIRLALTAILREEPRRYDLTGLDLVHVKVIDGALVPGGGPSCWQCSRLVLGAHLDGVWLYELPTVAEANAAGVTRADDPRHAALARWRYYPAEEFHRQTLEACGIGAPS